MTPFVLHDMRTSYQSLVGLVMARGAAVRVRGQNTYELLNASLEFDSPARPMLPVGIGRKINTKLAAVEALSLLAGTAEYRLTLAAAPSYAKVLVASDEDAFHDVAYGPRVGPSIDTVVHQLVTNPTTRQALLTVWRRDDLLRRGDKPCTLTIQFLLRSGKLHMIVNMRSNDVWLGLAYDAFVFSQLHWTITKQVAKQLAGVTIGTYYHHAASLHLYERDVEAAKQLQTLPLSNAQLALPLGVVCPQGFYPDQVATTLLRPDTSRPNDEAEVAALNEWYAKQLAAIDVAGA
jgi:thymidylate synthase